MNIAISGAGGFIGEHLFSYFTGLGHTVYAIPRILPDAQPKEIAVTLSGMDVIINLAGASIIGRWNKLYKKQILDSRILTTSMLVEAIKLMDKKPELFISASAVGIYSGKGVQQEESAEYATDYLGSVCQQWEHEAQKAKDFSRVCILRFGVVLGKNGGALKKMVPLFKLGLGGQISTGKQGYSWIHIDDTANAIRFIIENSRQSGVFNLTSPEMISNKEFTTTLASVLRRPAIFRVPSFILKLFFGEGSTVLTNGQMAYPKHLLSEGFVFTYPNLKQALTEVVN